MQQSLQNLASSVEGQLRTFTRTREGQNNLSPVDQSLRDSFLDLREEAKRGQESLLAASQTSSAEHKEIQSRIDQSTIKVIDTLCSKLDHLPFTVQQTHRSARLTNRQIRFFGENCEAILSPLFHLAPVVRQATLHIRTHHSKMVSLQQLSWFQSEFQNLVASATQEVAATFQTSTATPFDEWVYSQGLSNFGLSWEKRRDLPPTRQQLIFGPHSSADTNQLKAGSRRKRMKSDFQSFRFVSPSGMMQITLPSHKTGSSTSSSVSESVETGFLFLPSSATSFMVIEAHFEECIDFKSESRLYTQLNAFTLVSGEEMAKYRNTFVRAPIEDIDYALRNNMISPYAVDENGRSLCTFVSGYQVERLLIDL